MFFRKKIKELRPQDPNRTVNRLLAYGLVAFMIYTVVSGDRHKKQELPYPELTNDYTPIDWNKYISFTNLINGQNKKYYFLGNQIVRLELKKEEIKNLNSQPATGDDDKIPIYEVQLHAN